MIHVIIGDGKGKTSAAAGMALRAAGHGFKVIFAQFLKDDSSGEIALLRSVPQITTVHAAVNYGFTFQMTESQKAATAAEFKRMLDRLLSADAFLIVLDEVLHGLNAGLVDGEQLARVLDMDCEIVLTGRDAPQWILDRADYISDVRMVSHPYNRGVSARIGVEY